MKFLTLDGLPDYPDAWELAVDINQGWTGSISYARRLDIRQAIDHTVEMTLSDGISNDADLVKEDMLLRKRKRTWNRGGYKTTFDLLDETSNKLASGTESFDTFKNTTMAAIASAVATRFGVSVSGAPADPVHKEDIKQSTGWNPLQRIAAVAGLDLEVGLDGVVYFAPLATSGTASFKPDSVDEEYSPLDQIGKLFVSKRTGQGSYGGPQYFDFDTGGYKTGALESPLVGVTVSDAESTQGSIGWIGIWDGPPTGSGKLIALYPNNGQTVDALTVPVDGSYPATHFSCNVYPSQVNNSLPVEARLRINGGPPDPLPSGVEAAFAKLIVGGNLSARGFSSTFSDSLIPSEAYATARINAYLMQLNRGTDQLSISGPMRTGLRLRQAFTWDGITGWIVGLKWSGGASQVPRSEIVIEITQP